MTKQPLAQKMHFLYSVIIQHKNFYFPIGIAIPLPTFHLGQKKNHFYRHTPYSLQEYYFHKNKHWLFLKFQFKIYHPKN